MYIKCCYAESGWLSTHILPVKHTGNLITADLSKVLHQTQYSFLDDILCMCLYTQILAQNYEYKYNVPVCNCLIYFCPLVHGYYSK